MPRRTHRRPSPSERRRWRRFQARRDERTGREAREPREPRPWRPRSDDELHPASWERIDSQKR
jgi:hypothetical protein